jgi:hypothetical protein
MYSAGSNVLSSIMLCNEVSIKKTRTIVMYILIVSCTTRGGYRVKATLRKCCLNRKASTLSFVAQELLS